MANEGRIGIGSEEAKGPHDVFLCFCEADTRHSFTGNLYDALRRARLRTFMEDGAVKRGDRIASSILKALEASTISIVVLSQDFASSWWCLDELVKILECKKTKNQVVLPIFYDVDQSDVRDQQNRFGKAMDNHEHSLGKSSEKVHEWRSVLSEVANLSGGRCFKSDGSSQYEYKFVEDIVGWITETVPRNDVFLSFCGKDTRYSFTGFLYNALCRSGFKTFMNDGDQISQSTIEAIGKSRLSIIVFSKNYAHSSSCLDELLTILECMKVKNQLVWPIFYKVEPTDLRHKKNSYGKAMAEHENMLGKDSEKVQEWRSALFEVANLKGWHLKTRYEYELIKEIVETAIKI
ncbi:TMV resistance protein N [Spatholobus suberectus]|nr:TMV resistance protein N [Spatholobus suberectus]